MFLPLPQGFSSSPGYLLLAWRDREAGAKGSGQCAEPWIFLKAHLKRILKMKAYNFQCFWVSKEVTNGNGLKPQPGFVHGFTVVSIYCVQGKTKNKKQTAGVVTLWFWPSVAPAQYGSPWDGLLALCPSHHALDDATDGVCCQWFLNQFWAVGVRISYGCNTVRLSESSKRTGMN